MIPQRIKLLKKKFSKYNVDGYVIPKNDEFFSEYAAKDRLKNISNFTGSAGLAIITKKQNLLFVDGRYTIQAQEQCGKQFKIIKIHKFLPYKIIKNMTLGFDPSLFTYKQLNIYFKKSIKLKPINNNLIDEIYQSRNLKNKPFYSLNDKIIGESTKSKINKITNVLKKNKSDYIFISAPENVAWALNIRGYDNPNSPVPNSRLIIGRNKKVYLIAEKKKVSKIAP